MAEVPKIIFPVGHHASGKTELCDYLAGEHGFRVIETGSMMRRLYGEREEEYHELDIKSYVKQKLTDDEGFFDDYLNSLIRSAEEDSNLVAVNGMRSYDNIQRIRLSRPQAQHEVVWIDAPNELLYERYLMREKIQMPFDEFCDLLEVDLALGLGEIEGVADHRIDNTGSVSELRVKSEEVLRLIANKAIQFYE
jgi:dephospho-CoA kinase